MVRIALAGLLPVLFAAPVLAQEPPDNSTVEIVTEAEFLATLHPSHPAIAESSAVLAEARARLPEASAFENPVLGAELEDPSGPERQTEWTLSWQLPHAERRFKIEAAERNVEATAADFAQAILNHRLTMRRIYSDWAVAVERRVRLERHWQRVQALVQRETLRAERGESSGLAARRLALAARAIEARLALLTHAETQTRAEARSWSPDLPLTAQPQLPETVVTPELLAAPSSSGDPTDEGHPWFEAARLEIDVARLEQQAAGRILSSPELMVGWQRQELGPATVDGSLVGLSWSLPLFQRRQADQALAEARLSAAEARLQRRLHEFAAQRSATADSYRALTTALTEVKAAQAEQEVILRGAEAAFQHGELSLTDLLEILRAVTDADMSLLDLHAEALAMSRELERLAGPRAISSTELIGKSTSPLSPAPQALEKP